MPTLYKYIAVGGISYLAELIIIFICIQGIGLSSVGAVAISFWVGLLLSFTLQKLFTFDNKNRSPKQLLWQTVSYGTVVAINYIFTIGVIALLDSVTGAYIARTIALAITTAWNYFLYKKLIFSNNPIVTSKIILRTAYALLLAFPVVIMCLPMLLSGTSTLFAGDFDQQIQMTEAARKSIVEYGQFPLWNPWVSGGVPLFADPQFNIFSPALLFSFFTTSIYAWKLTIFVYLLVGLYGMRKLLIHLTNNSVISTLFAYIWIFGSFFLLRSIGGHFTFLNLTLLPLFIYLVTTLFSSNRRVPHLALLTAYTFYSSIHYATIFIGIIVGSLCLYLVLLKAWNRQWDIIKSFVQNIAYAAILAFLLAAPRILVTLDYLRTNKVSRNESPEYFIGWKSGIESLVIPYGKLHLPHSSFGAFEASNYIGIVTVLAVILAAVAVIALAAKGKVTFSKKHFLIFFVCAGLAGFLLGVGGAPFNTLHQLPVFSSMRVSTRFLFITSFSIIVVGAILFGRLYNLKSRYGRYVRAALVIVLAAACLQVYVDGFMLNARHWKHAKEISAEQSSRHGGLVPRSEKRWQADESPPYVNHAVTSATISNRAQVYVDNALVNTDTLPTVVCDEDENRCSFVLSGNAIVKEWSPNRIVLQRTGHGAIQLNMNLGKRWRVNNTFIFKNLPNVSTSSPFTLPETEDTHYVLEYHL